MINRTIDITTLDSVTPSLWVDGAAEVMLVFATGSGAITIPAVITLEGSDDNIVWYDLDAVSLTGVNPDTGYRKHKIGVLSKFLRARVTTAGDGSLNYVLLKTRG